MKLNGKLAAYYFVFCSSLVLFTLMLRLVGSPLGTVLKAIRENETRAEAIGYRVVSYRTFVFCIAALVASLAGSIYAIWLKYTGPETALSFAIMIDILLMVVIGGMGTMWGAVIGARADGAGAILSARSDGRRRRGDPLATAYPRTPKPGPLAVLARYHLYSSGLFLSQGHCRNHD